MSATGLKTEPSASAEKPSGVRYWIVGLATLMAVLLYLDRYCTSFTERFIKEELKLTNTQTSWLLGAFFISYGLGQLPSGWLSDRYGSRLMLTLYILIWSVMTGLMGLAGSFLLVMVFRLGLGLGQAGAYPTGALMISKWMPFSQRGLASGIVSTGGRLGAVLAPILTAFLLIAFMPSDKSPRLEPDDILDGRQLCNDLVHPHKRKPHVDKFAEKIRSRLSPEANAIVAAGASESGPAPSSADLTLLIGELNAENWYGLVEPVR